jgi:L-lactate permease
MLFASDPFVQPLNPVHSTLGTTIVALVPLVLLLVLLAVVRMTAWQAVIIGAVVTIVLAITIWNAPAGQTAKAWAIGAGTGIWAIDWITFWGVVIYYTLVETGAFGDLRRWLVGHATADVRVQAILLAWSLGALLEGLVGFGYPWAVIAPILVGLGIIEIDAIRVARHREQRARLVRRARCADHHARGRHRIAAHAPVGVRRPDRRLARPRASGDPDRARQRPEGAARRLAARCPM